MVLSDAGTYRAVWSSRRRLRSPHLPYHDSIGAHSKGGVVPIISAFVAHLMRAPMCRSARFIVGAISLRSVDRCDYPSGGPGEENGVMRFSDAVAVITEKVEAEGLLLVHDQRLPSVTALICAEPVFGSWWSHPLANVIYNALGGGGGSEVLKPCHFRGPFRSVFSQRMRREPQPHCLCRRCAGNQPTNSRHP